MPSSESMRLLAAGPPGAENPPTFPPVARTLWQGMISATGFFAIAWPPQPLGMGRLRAAWSWLKQTDLIPDKGQFRSRFPHPLSYCCPATIFRDILAALFGRLRVVKGQSSYDGRGS